MDYSTLEFPDYSGQRREGPNLVCRGAEISNPLRSLPHPFFSSFEFYNAKLALITRRTYAPKVREYVLELSDGRVLTGMTVVEMASFVRACRYLVRKSINAAVSSNSCLRRIFRNKVRIFILKRQHHNLSIGPIVVQVQSEFIPTQWSTKSCAMTWTILRLLKR